MTDELTKMIEDASRKAEKYFRKWGVVAPQYLALCGDGEWITFDASHSNDMERDISRMMVRALFEERNVQRYVFVAEAWTSSPEVKVAPADDPNRQECVLIIAEDRTLGQVYGMRPIDRNGKRPKLTPLQVERPKEIVGRYGSMLTPMNGTQTRN